MATKQKRARVKTDLETKALHFEFLGPKKGDEYPVTGKATYKLEGLKSEIVTRLALHGMKQKLSDSFADAANMEESPHEAANGVYENLLAGAWSERGDGGPRVGLLVKAIARVKKVSIEKATEAVNGFSEDQIKAVKGVPAIAKAMADIKAEEAAEAAKAAGEKAKGAKPEADAAKLLDGIK